MSIRYEITDTLSPMALQRLFQQTDWAHERDESRIHSLIQNSNLQVCAWDDELLVGYARALTDEVTRAFIEDVVVDADYRGEGVGTQMLTILTERLADVEEIVLCCQPRLVSYYARLGFIPKELPHLYRRRAETL